MKVIPLKWRVNNDPLMYGLISSARTLCDDVEIYSEEDTYAVIFQSYPDYEKSDFSSVEKAKEYAQKKHEEIVKENVLRFLDLEG